MPLTAGPRLGPYEILAPLGVGGMGEIHALVMELVDGATLAERIATESIIPHSAFRIPH